MGLQQSIERNQETTIQVNSRLKYIVDRLKQQGADIRNNADKVAMPLETMDFKVNLCNEINHQSLTMINEIETLLFEETKPNQLSQTGSVSGHFATIPLRN